MAEWACSDYRPCHYVAVDRAHRRIVLAIRGSLEPGDFLTDVCPLVSCPEPCPSSAVAASPSFPNLSSFLDLLDILCYPGLPAQCNGGQVPGTSGA